MGKSVSELLANFWATAHYDDIPSTVVDKAKQLLLDHLGVAIAGAQSDFARCALSGATLSSPSGSSVVLGRNERFPGPISAFLNGIASHVFELDDFGGCGHSGAVVFPALFGVMPVKRLSGRHLLVSTIAGYDVAARVLEGSGGYYQNDSRGWHTTGTCGSFGAAAAASKALGLDAEGFAAALGIAGSFTGGIWAFLEDGSPTKSLHCGRAAENGLSAALLACAGMDGPRFVLDAPWGGFFSTYSCGSQQPHAALQNLGSDFRILATGLKTHACCRGLHVYVDALLSIIEHENFELDQIETIIVHGTDYFRRKFDRPDIGSSSQAQFSIQYALTATLLFGEVSFRDLFPAPRLNTSCEPIAKLIKISDRSAGAAFGQCPPVEVRLSDGRSLIGRVTNIRGAPDSPLAPEELHQKFVALTSAVIGEHRSQQIISFVSELESADDMMELVELTRPLSPAPNTR